MIKSIEQLRGMRGNYATYEDLVMRCCDIADEIESEVEARYIERPVDADGMTISPYDNMVDSNGEQFTVSSIELLTSGEWLVYGNGKPGTAFAKLCHHYKPPTVEDVLNELCTKAFHSREIGANVSYKDVIAEYAKRLQIREEQ